MILISNASTFFHCQANVARSLKMATVQVPLEGVPCLAKCQYGGAGNKVVESDWCCKARTEDGHQIFPPVILNLKWSLACPALPCPALPCVPCLPSPHAPCLVARSEDDPCHGLFPQSHSPSGLIIRPPSQALDLEHANLQISKSRLTLLFMPTPDPFPRLSPVSPWPPAQPKV